MLNFSGKNDKMHSTDKILVLKPMEGKNTLSTKGMIDNRLFTKGNSLHIKLGPQGLWIFKQDVGGLTEPLKQKFTGYDKILKYAKEYFAKRNVEIVEVIDSWD